MDIKENKPSFTGPEVFILLFPFFRPLPRYPHCFCHRFSAHTLHLAQYSLINFRFISIQRFIKTMDEITDI